MSRKLRSLKEEKKIWYKKLKEEGFDDIESSNGSLRAGLHNDLIHKAPVVREAIQEYYYMATHFLNNYKFKTKRDQIIWEYHINGLSSRDIASALEKVEIQLDQSNVVRIISRLSKVMKTTTQWMSDYTPPENLQ